VKVPDSKEIANRAVPESCAAYREVRREALTGVRIGQPSSHESQVVPGADAVTYAEGNTHRRVIRERLKTRRGRRPWHVRTLLAREPGDLQSDRRGRDGSAARIGKARSRSR